jgi:hypothetical protein
MNTQNGVGMGNGLRKEGSVHAFTVFSGSGAITEEKNGDLTEEQARKCRRLVAEGMAEHLATAAVRGEGVEL